MYIDSHCHLDLEPLKEEKQAAIERAAKAGVTKIINIGSSLRGSRASVELANSYPNIWASVGLHPHDAETVSNIEDIIFELESLAQNDKVVAIGEIGLDYFDPGSSDQRPGVGVIERQKELFEAQLELAVRLNLPVIIHTRDAEEDTLKILKKWTHKLKGRTLGAIHCFTGDAEFAKKLLELGFYIGFTGFITFEQNKFNHIREAVKVVPLERLLIETDAPFLAPEPYRGKMNEPAYVVEVAKKVAELQGVAVEEVAEKTLLNAKKLFNIS